MTLFFLWLQLLLCAGVILAASGFLAGSAEAFAVRTGLGRGFISVLLLSTATSLPELGTGISSVALVGVPDLAAGNVFGSNLCNLLIVAILALAWRKGSLFRALSPAVSTLGLLSLVIIGLAMLIILLHHSLLLPAAWPPSALSVLLLAAFVTAMYVIYRQEHKEKGTAPPAAMTARETVQGGAEVGLLRILTGYLAAAGVVMGAAIFLAEIGERLAAATALEASYVGTQFLAFSTTLPELAASVAALRLGLPEMAVANLLGSNLFNMGFILFADDVAFRNGSFWAAISGTHLLSGLAALLMTLVVLFGLARHRNRPPATVPWEAILLILLYLAASISFFHLA